MREHESFSIIEDDYWVDDLAIGQARIGTETSTVRLRLHAAEECYYGRAAGELIPLTHPEGVATYIHAQPYVLEPAITFSIDLFPTPTETGAIGEVVDSGWAGMRHRDIGTAQAWWYPADRVVVLWECVLDDAVRQDDPNGDGVLATVWTGFERALLDRFPAARRVATPSWEDLYERPAWQQFLGGQGYEPFTPGCFVKDLADATESRSASGG